MKKITAVLAVCAAIGLAPGATVAQSNSPLTLSRPGGHLAHVFPHYKIAKELGLIRENAEKPTGTPALLYHGGPIMQPNLRFYIVYWQPATLQDGSPTSMSTGYKTVQANMVDGYNGHPLGSITTQYYQKIGKTTFVNGLGSLVATFTDTHPFPTSGCASSLGPNCFTDDQLEAEVQSVITSQHWTPGFDAMFLFFISSGEASCFDNTGQACSTNYYCAYHSYFGSSNNIVYSNEPFGDPVHCMTPGTPEPNLALGGAEADPAAGSASHEMTEAITDPQLNAWFDSQGSEIGDICAYIYGKNGWAKKTANQYWNGHPFELQTEYDNHVAACTLVGP